VSLIDTIWELIHPDEPEPTGVKFPYLDSCDRIWKEYVPERGRSSALQGELLRQVELLRTEARENGNLNWDESYTASCDFIAEHLVEQKGLPLSMRNDVSGAVKTIMRCGFYAERCFTGEVPQEEVDVARASCASDEPFDVICNAIGKLDEWAGDSIAYEA